MMATFAGALIVPVAETFIVFAEAVVAAIHFAVFALCAAPSIFLMLNAGLRDKFVYTLGFILIWTLCGLAYGALNVYFGFADRSKFQGLDVYPTFAEAAMTAIPATACGLCIAPVLLVALNTTVAEKKFTVLEHAMAVIRIMAMAAAMGMLVGALRAMFGVYRYA
jgi:hypothetical protein